MSRLAEAPLLRGEAAVGAVVHRAVVSAALGVVFASGSAGLLALAGLWTPVVVVPVLLVLVALAIWFTRPIPVPALPVWSAVAMVVLAAGFTVWAGVTHAEQVLPRRDAGSTFQSALDLAQHHARPIEVSAAEVGGAAVLRVDGITLESPAFYSVGSPSAPAVEPQFLVGPAALTSLGAWVGGPSGLFWVPALVSGLGLLALGLLAAAVAGARWGPLAMTGCGLCFPVLRVARSTYSEPFAILVLAAGLLVLTLAARSATSSSVARAAVRRAGLIAGVLVAGGALIRPDALRETLLLVVVLGLAAAQRQAYAGPAAVGAGALTVAAAVLGLSVSRSYLTDIGASLVPLTVLLVVVTALAAAGVRLSRSGARLPLLAQAWLARATGAVVALGLVGLASRPLWQTVRQSAADSGARVVAALQQAQGLRVDGGRTYAEHTVGWLAWWVGWPALAIASVVAVLSVARAAQHWSDGRGLPSWTGALLVGLGSTVLTLYRPGITPDHPWADRRLLVALPCLVLLVVAGTAGLSRWATRRLPVAVAPSLTAALALVLLVPMTLATWPHRSERVEHGSLGAVRTACAAFEQGDVALLLDDRAANEWTQVLRGQCGVASVATTAALRRDPAALTASTAEVARLVAASGHRLVLVSARSAGVLDVVGAQGVRQVVGATVLEDPRLLERRPDTLVPLPVTLWVSAPAAPR